MRILSLMLLSFGLFACSSDESDDDDTQTEDAGHHVDASTTRPDGGTPLNDASSDASTAGTCAAASASLQHTSDASAPVLDLATSLLQRVSSNDAGCTSQHAAHPGFGNFGYLLNVAYTDSDGDAPALSDLSETGGFMRFGSAPEAQVDTRFDPAHGWTTQGSAQQGTLILQLCLEREYVAGELSIAVDLADLAGHRSAAICIGEQTGR